MLRTLLHFSLRGLYRSLRILLLLAVAALLMLRHWILPDIERYHEAIVYAVSHALGKPVIIGRIEADWYGFRPHLLLVNVRILDQKQQAALVLERVESEVAWTSLFAGEVRLYGLEIDQPDLYIRRDAQGQMFIAGMPLSAGASGSGSSDWLLNQSRIVVREARITWQDDLRAAPPLVFNEVNLLIDNGWLRHRFALRALPPSELASGLDVRGEFRGGSFDDPAGWSGQLYTQLDYADVAAWRTWVSLPVPLSRGQGALRGWLDVEHGRVGRITTDLALAGVRTRLASDLPALDLRTLRGRIGWSDVAGGTELFTRGLSLKLRDGMTLAPTDFYLRFAATQERQWASGEVRANLLDLHGLTLLSEYLPLDLGFRRQLQAFAPRGKITELQASWDNGAGPLRYGLKGHFNGLAARYVEGVPGFSGLTGWVEGNETKGRLSLDARRLTIDAQNIMKEKLQFDTLSASIGWERDAAGLGIKLDNVSLANADLSGSLYGSYHTEREGPGSVDLGAHLTHAQVRQVGRYIPVPALGEAVHSWLGTGLQGGVSDDVNMRLAGDLKDFPFGDGRPGQFRIRAHIKDGTIEFLKDWPRIEDGEGVLLIEGRRLEVQFPSATTAGNALHKVSAIFPDLGAQDLVLQVYGEADGEIAKALEYIHNSPVRSLLGGFTDAATARGNGALNLLLHIPLRGGKPLRLNGSYRFNGGDIDLGGAIPLLQQVQGELLFTEATLNSRNLTTRTLGGPAVIAVRSGADKTIEVTASGNSNMDVLRGFSSLPLLRYLHGGSPWELQAKVQDGLANVAFSSSLAGLTSDLPAPFNKRADEKSRLQFKLTGLNERQGELSLQYGNLLDARLMRERQDAGWVVSRGNVVFGAQNRWPQRSGVWLVGAVPQLSLDGWGPLLEGAGEQGQFNLGGADLHLHRVSGYGMAIDDMHVEMHASNGVLSARLASKPANGDLVWQPQDKGVLAVHLKNLALPAAGADSGAGKPVATAGATRRDSPLYQLSVDELTYQNKHLGRLELQARQHAGDWQMERLTLANPDGLLTADGKWTSGGNVPQTQLNFRLEIGDAGKTLARYGYPDSMKGGGGKLEGSLSWHGSPYAFSYAALGGTLRLGMGKGRFLKIDPGAGKLLGILSLQALPQHIALDFTDVFSEGFSFDSINGSVQVNQGIVTTNDFRLDGPAAKVTMSGMVDLPREAQNLQVTILPEVGGGAAVVSGLVAGPVVGVGVLLANKILRNPLEKLASYEYNVTGTWADPVVARAGAGKK